MGAMGEDARDYLWWMLGTMVLTGVVVFAVLAMVNSGGVGGGGFSFSPPPR